ncbi:hypothetical protein SZ55_4167 [Pseudomonas sp. FeS53a]|nr:hypothetical protein SZ55_4167 [Pseudomonas sp. FeS53a]
MHVLLFSAAGVREAARRPGRAPTSPQHPPAPRPLQRPDDPWVIGLCQMRDKLSPGLYQPCHSHTDAISPAMAAGHAGRGLRWPGPPLALCCSQRFGASSTNKHKSQGDRPCVTHNPAPPAPSFPSRTATATTSAANSCPRSKASTSPTPPR